MKRFVAVLLLTGCLVKKEENNTYPCTIVTPPKASKIELTLINGKPADPKDWPTIFTTSQGSSRCTGTVIGPKVLQLAAHCVQNGKTASFMKDNVKYVGTCTHHSGYRNDPTSDYALCLLDKEVALPWYETITDKEVSIGDDLLLAGMGCTQPGGGGGNDNVLRVGLSKVVEIPTTDNDIVTEGNAALCFGDSGGSAFMKVDDEYKVAAINSRGDIQTASYLPAVYTKSAKDFYAKWSEANKVDICGVTKGAKLCRGDKPIPPKPPEPTPPLPPEPTPPGPVPPGPTPPAPKPNECPK